ncbi:MAG: type I DNA topoisomerase [Pseudomonadaceae bacterium]|nr:type I DNA topoisomerase [Pseudomonadaceae bacterium]
MSNHAVIVVESPAKGKTIEKYLGPGYKVLASYGHIRDLPSKDGSVDVDNDFAMHYSVNKDSEKNIKAIMSELKKADTLYLATDPDREGEAIAWHVWEEVKRRDPKLALKLSVHRSTFEEITKSAIQNAIAHPRELSLNLINAQQARRALDYLVGFNLSPVLWRKVKGGLSAGRVQSVALRLICERENEIEAFRPEEYWSIHGAFTTPDGKPLPANLVQYNGSKVEKFSFTNEADATAAVAALGKESYAVTDLEKAEKRRFPAAPFTTSTLQQEAARKLGFAARRTMMAAQRLYEAGHITYMRTDSVNLATEAVAKLRSHIEKKYGKNYLPAQPLAYKSKQKNAQEAHEAIRPTDPTTSHAGADDDQNRLYQLILQRTVACQMTPARLEQTTITVGGGTHRFRATGSVILFPGFLSVYQEGRDDDTADDDDKILPAVKEGDKLATQNITTDQHFTEPPPRYSEATLVKTLEEYGIGRPSTFASIISTIQDRGYVRLEKKRFFPEDVGRVVNKFLTEHFTQYVDYNFTANMEDELDAIAEGDINWKTTLKKFWQPFKTLVDDKIESVKKSDVTTEATGEMCPECGKHELVYRLGRYGKFKGCSGYPECSYIEKNESAAPAAQSTGIPCPSCKEGELLKRTSRMGKIFYGCNRYPDCKYAVWDAPQQVTCPDCNWPITVTKISKKYGEWHRCPQPDCDWNDNAEAAAATAAFRTRFTKAKEAKAAAKTKTKPKAKPKTTGKAKSKSPSKAK